MTGNNTCIPEVKHGVDDFIIRLAEAQHYGRLGVHPTLLGRPQHLQALHIACACVPHPPLHPPNQLTMSDVRNVLQEFMLLAPPPELLMAQP